MCTARFLNSKHLDCLLCCVIYIIRCLLLQILLFIKRSTLTRILFFQFLFCLLDSESRLFHIKICSSNTGLIRHGPVRWK